MIETIIGLIFVCILLGVIYWAVQQLLPLIPLAEPFKTIVRVLMVLILVIIVIYAIKMLLEPVGVNVPFPKLR